MTDTRQDRLKGAGQAEKRGLTCQKSAAAAEIWLPYQPVVFNLPRLWGQDRRLFQESIKREEVCHPAGQQTQHKESRRTICLEGQVKDELKPSFSGLHECAA